ncbi:DUF1614 domain-containing protein [Methanomicrobium antiquum]|uniref:DUF1614 domain-containing protein n=1 Tax=Methanomicrobium antiquum TaxID=487686 RepID=A0AAF0FUR6_9EURY|nr:DUF1614 domain-containing protein [Methanomicrobium antiquum]WFN36290.1 DUF1614 domain-containing protein [Methanomicrobium antiquum]
MARYFFNPLSVFLLIFLILFLILLIPFMFLGIIGGALYKLGFGLWQIIFLVFAMIIGSFINLPVTRIKSNPQFVRVPHGYLTDRLYRAPEFSTDTTIALNVGGCIIPVIVSGYLLFQAFSISEWENIIISVFIGIIIVSAVTKLTAKPVAGVGIATPIFIPPLCALLCGLLLSGGISLAAPVIAYISGTIGTLIGADILNLKKMGELNTSVASIGGAGTFDGVFLAGIIAAFLA